MNEPGKTVTVRGRILLLLACLIGECYVSGSSYAAEEVAEYPAKPVRIIVPFTASGGVDILARRFGAKFAESLKQSFTIENRTGAGGTIGVSAAARAVPDGSVLVLTSNSLVFNATLYKDLPYDTLKDLAPISLVANSPNVLVVHPSLPVKSMQEFVRFAKARPGTLHYGSGGVGGSSHICAEYLLKELGLKVVHVPYKGVPPSLTDVISGQIDLVMAPISIVPELLRAGRLRALGVTSTNRSAIMPEVPTISESGIANFNYTTWYGLLAPAGTPAGIISILNAETRRAAQAPDMRVKLLADGVEPQWSSAESFAATIKLEITKWAPVLRATAL